MEVQVTRSSMPEYKEYIDEIKELWDTRWLTNNGVKHKQLERELVEYMGVKNVKLFTNGHLALEYIIQAFDLKGEIITVPFTFASTTHAIVRNGIRPVFCDVNEDNYTIDVEQIESLISDKTTAIMPVHVYGNICNVEVIDKIAKKYNLKVIYDAAHAFGIKFKGQGIGSYGDASMFSFHATKVFHTIEGGAIACSDKKVLNKLEALKNFGIESEDSISFAGGNAKMNEFQAAMGICNLRHIEKEISKREIIFKRYIENLREVQGIKVLNNQKDVKSNYAYFPIILDEQLVTRDNLINELESRGIKARKYFYPLTSNFKCYESLFKDNKTPIAEKISNNVLCLPMYSDLSLEMVDKICSIIKR